MEFLRVEDSYFPRNLSLNCGGKLFTTTVPQIMGILNCTPDSFYGESRFSLTDNYLAAAGQMIAEGASILDIGGYSSRPGADHVSAEEETARVVPVVAAVKKAFPDVLVSIDTFRAQVVKAAVESGADIVNDISGGSLDPGMFSTVGKLGCPYILMHMKGTPQTMQSETQYNDLFADMCRYFSERILQLKAHGVKDIILDPGFGFAKNIPQNFELLSRLEQFHFLDYPLLAGLSRKSTVYKTLGTTPEEALNGTTVLNTIALSKGAMILRVHDVKAAAESVILMENVKLKTQKGIIN
jgi:dihydropteroate synthase